MEFLFSSSSVNVYLDENGQVYMEENMRDNYGFLALSLEEMQEIVTRLSQLNSELSDLETGP